MARPDRADTGLDGRQVASDKGANAYEAERELGRQIAEHFGRAMDYLGRYNFASSRAERAAGLALVEKRQSRKDDIAAETEVGALLDHARELASTGNYEEAISSVAKAQERTEKHVGRLSPSEKWTLERGAIRQVQALKDFPAIPNAFVADCVRRFDIASGDRLLACGHGLTYYRDSDEAVPYGLYLYPKHWTKKYVKGKELITARECNAYVEKALPEAVFKASLSDKGDGGNKKQYYVKDRVLVAAGWVGMGDGQCHVFLCRLDQEKNVLSGFGAKCEIPSGAKIIRASPEPPAGDVGRPK